MGPYGWAALVVVAACGIIIYHWYSQLSKAVEGLEKESDKVLDKMTKDAEAAAEYRESLDRRVRGLDATTRQTLGKLNVLKPKMNTVFDADGRRVELKYLRDVMEKSYNKAMESGSHDILARAMNEVAEKGDWNGGDSNTRAFT